MAFYLSGKSVSKGKLIGYFLGDGSGKQILAPVDKVIKLAESGRLQDWQVVTDSDGEKHLYSDRNSIAGLPVYVKNCDEHVKPIRVLQRDGVTEGYGCMTRSGVQLNYTVDTFWQLVKLGMVDGVTAKRCGNTRVLESKDNYLKELPTLVI